MDRTEARGLPDGGITDVRRGNGDTLAAAQLSRNPRLETLRCATRALHQQLDRDVSAAGYFETPSRYANYMTRMASFQSEFDSACMGICDPWLKRWNIAERTAWLALDLSALGCEQRSPRRTHLKFETPSHLLGGLYVVIGAGLGARVLVQRAAAVALPNGQGTAYLAGLGTTTRWSEFVSFLEHVPQICSHEMIEGAVRTFACVAAHLSERTAP